MDENMDRPTMEGQLGSPAAEMKSKKRSSTFQRASVLQTKVEAWAVQCSECYKWRVIPTQEEYEVIRKKIKEDPFTCNKKQNVSCNDSADLEYGSKCIWVLDKPNIPKTPAGFKRRVVLRKNFSRMDCFYETPSGKKLRGPTDVASFLEDHPDHNDVSQADFSFTSPKIARDTIAQYIAGKKG